jgi:ribonuclease HI
MAQRKYYAVVKGRKTGVFTSWQQCEAQVKGFSGAIYKSFSTRQEAEAALDAGQANGLSRSQTSQLGSGATQLFTTPLIANSICVDAACSGNPGAVEYQGVWTEAKDVAFHKGPIPHGTNNLGEFLAIVHALAYLQQSHPDMPIYTDSETAILWVKKKAIRTTLQRNSRSEEIFGLIDRAIAWLQTNEYGNPILKWDTKAWGEIPADFGRK